MTELSELDAIKSIGEALSGVSDPITRDRILKWAWDKFSQTPSETPVDERANIVKKKAKKTTRKTTKTKTTPSIVKNLNLKPDGEESFKEFADSKKPSTNMEKCVVSVHYLANILQETQVDTNHVYTCFKEQGWRIPSDLNHSLRETASEKGWLDPSNMSKIKLTPHGENLIEHDLPKAKKESK